MTDTLSAENLARAALREWGLADADMRTYGDHLIGLPARFNRGIVVGRKVGRPLTLYIAPFFDGGHTIAGPFAVLLEPVTSEEVNHA